MCRARRETFGQSSTFNDGGADNYFLQHLCTQLSSKTSFNARLSRLELSGLRKSLMRKTHVEEILLTELSFSHFLCPWKTFLPSTKRKWQSLFNFIHRRWNMQFCFWHSIDKRRDAARKKEIYRRESVGPFKWRREISFNAGCKKRRGEEKDVGQIDQENKSLQRIIRKCSSPCVLPMDGISYLMN